MTAVYGTLGPACAKQETLEAMFAAGMTGMRLNLSHTSLAESAERLELFHAAARSCGVQPELLIDLQGPELRCGAFETPLPLPEGSRIPLEALKLPAVLTPWLTPGQELLLDDGRLLLRTGENGQALTVRGGVLHSRKSVKLPGREIPLPLLTGHDLENIRQAGRWGVTGLMQPFVRSGEELASIRQTLRQMGAGELKIFAKIESMEGVRHLEGILAQADTVIIARGDLGNDMPLWQLPAVQKDIAAACRRAGRPFITVTQMLASMEQNPVPTRAEVSDIFNAVLDGSAGVMLTGETAAGRYPAQAIRYMASTVRQAEEWLARR